MSFNILLNASFFYHLCTACITVTITGSFLRTPVYDHPTFFSIRPNSPDNTYNKLIVYTRLLKPEQVTILNAEWRMKNNNSINNKKLMAIDLNASKRYKWNYKEKTRG